jgi:hypothetical protein
MNTAHEEFAAIARAGAQRFSSTGLASSHASVARTVRRHRVMRGSVTAVAGVGIVGAGAFGVLQLRGADAVGPMGTPSPSSTVSPSPTTSPAPSAEPTAPSEEPESVAYEVVIEPGMRADEVIAIVADEYDVSEDEARDAIVAALPADAEGEPEGWLGTGDYGNVQDVETLGEKFVGSMETQLAEAGLTQDERSLALTVASIVEAEAAGGSAEDMAGIAAVILNRLDEDLRLEIESPLRYYAAINGLDPSDDGWLIDTPYNTYMYAGLPPTPIGSPSTDAIDAAANPADEDWMFYVVDSRTGDVLFATTFEEHQENLVAVGAIEPGDIE